MLKDSTHATIAEIAATEKINEFYVGRVLRCLAGRPKKRKYSFQFRTHLGNPSLSKKQEEHYEAA
jgi:hypothetical protein